MRVVVGFLTFLIFFSLAAVFLPLDLPIWLYHWLLAKMAGEKPAYIGLTLICLKIGDWGADEAGIG